ncbi:MAG: hypothetical protein JW781_05370 [Deltaproteobacteria bacterium]|nr:hypothetical protein [Candidatus Anaeroferrophillacea bacterium]
MNHPGSIPSLPRRPAIIAAGVILFLLPLFALSVCIGTRPKLTAVRHFDLHRYLGSGTPCTAPAARGTALTVPLHFDADGLYSWPARREIGYRPFPPVPPAGIHDGADRRVIITTMNNRPAERQPTTEGRGQ